MNSEDNKKQVDSALTGKSVAVNEGTFLLRINKNDVNQSDFVKQCLYGDAFRSAYSPHLVMIPTSIFLPQMLAGKNIFMEHKLGRNKLPMLDSFLPFSFLLMPEGAMARMFDDTFTRGDRQSYSEIYADMKRSVLHHMQDTKKTATTPRFPNEKQMLNAVADTETDLYLKENDDKYTVIFFTQSSSVRIQQSDCRELNFGDSGSHHVVPLSNSNMVAQFDGISNGGETCNVKLSPAVTSAIKRELLTFTQLFVGYEKRPSENVGDYLRNINYLFNGQLKSIRTDNDENVESYTLAALKLYLSRNLEIDEEPVARQHPILEDERFMETIEKKILFQLLMVMDKGSCFNARRLVKKVDGGKSTIVCAETYTNPFAELVRAFYENVSWLTSLLTMSTLFARVKNRSCCPSCQQCTCATIAPSLMFAHSANRLAARKDRTGAVLCFHTITAFNKTGPLGNLKRVPPSTDLAAAAENGGNVVMWDKHHSDLLRSLVDSYQLDLQNLHASATTEENIEERAESCMKHICMLIDGAIGTSDEFCRGLSDVDADSKYNNVESEIRNVYRVNQMYDKGLANVLLSESLMYLLRSILLYDKSSFWNESVSDVFLKIRPLLLDNKSGFTVYTGETQKATSLPKIAVKSYSSDGIDVDVESQVSEIYNFDELLYHVSFKTKTYLYGRYDERRNNGGRKKPLQNISRNSSASTMSMNNSFLHFKNFCSKEACKALGIHEDDYCRNVLNEIRDEMLEKYASLFKYVTQYKVEDWSAMLQLVAVMKILEYLNFAPSYDRLSMLSFNSISKIGSSNRYQFKQSLLTEEFGKFETMYAQSCTMIEYSADIQGKRLVFKKCSGRLPDCYNELLNAYSSSKMHPGSPIYYIAFGEKNGGYSVESGSSASSFLEKFLNVEQYRMETDATYTQYILKNRKRFYDAVFSSIFSEQRSCVENMYTPEVLADMMSEFDEILPQSLFANEQIHGFLKLVLVQFFDQDQSKVAIAASRIREINARAVNRGKKRQLDDDDDESSGARMLIEGAEEEDYQSMRKRARNQ
ncbi:MAG: hypothetical protein ABW185_04405 [Sedimenticola sp.]